MDNQSKELRKNRRNTILITIIVTIIVWSAFIVYGYQWVTYYQCRHSNTVLYGYEQGKIEKITDASLVDDANTGRWLYYSEGEISNVIDNGMGYLKIYRNNILITMSVDDPMADLKSYFSPKYWITGTRSIRNNIVYQIRDENKYQKALKQLEENEVPNRYLLKIGDECFVN